jgi:hypothetical protein
MLSLRRVAEGVTPLQTLTSSIQPVKLFQTPSATTEPIEKVLPEELLLPFM